jgi:hypothetical protein
MLNKCIVLNLTLVGLLLLQLGCTNSKLSNRTPEQYSAQQDSTIFASLVRYVKKNGLSRDNPQRLKSSLRIDPHRIDTTHSFNDKLKTKVLQTPAKQLQQRRLILKTNNLPTANAIADQKCIYYGGLRPPPEQDNSDKIDIPQHCKQIGLNSFISIIFGSPSIAADSNCTNSDSKQLENPNATCWQVKAKEYTSSSVFIFVLYLLKTPSKGWEVIHKEKIGGSIS